MYYVGNTDSLLKLFKKHLANYRSGSEWSVNILPSCTPTMNTLSCYSSSCLTSVSTFWQIKSLTCHTKEPRLRPSMFISGLWEWWYVQLDYSAGPDLNVKDGLVSKHKVLVSLSFITVTVTALLCELCTICPHKRAKFRNALVKNMTETHYIAGMVPLCLYMLLHRFKF